MRTRFIVNPRAATGTTGLKWHEWKQVVRYYFSDADHVFTEKDPASVRKLVDDAVWDEVGHIIIVGGDGTLSAVIQGIAPAAQKPVFSLVPAGRGNDFARLYGLTPDIHDSLFRAAHGTDHKIDAGEIRYSDDSITYFINQASTGMGAKVVQEMNASRLASWIGASAAFLTTAFNVALEFRNLYLRIHTGEEQFEVKSRNLVVANGRYAGGGMMFAPMALVDDGFLDVVSFGDFSVQEFISKIGTLYTGNFLGHEKILHRKVKSLRIEAADGRHSMWEADGESIGALPVSISVLPAHLTFRV